MTNEQTHHETTRRDSSLVLLNACLLLLVGMLAIGPTLLPSAFASQPAERRPGAYTMVSGELQGSTADALYIIDTENRELVALKWNRSQKQLEGIGFRRLGRDQQEQDQPR